MKRTIIAVITTVVLLGIIAGTPPKEFNLKLTDTQLNQLWFVLDQSTAPHATVKELQDVILPQIQKQMADTTNKK